jgi:hypothetical protein
MLAMKPFQFDSRAVAALAHDAVAFMLSWGRRARPHR